MRMPSIAIVLYDGLHELDAIAPFEVLRTASQTGADLSVTLVGSEAKRTFVGSHGLRVEVEALLGDTPCDWLLVPGGAWYARGQVGCWERFSAASYRAPSPGCASVAMEYELGTVLRPGA